MKQTAVEWLAEQINPDMKTMQGNIIQDLLEQAKEMEKQHIIDAWDDGDYAYFYSKETFKDFENGLQYYNEVFTKEVNHGVNTTKCYCGHTTYCDCGPEDDLKDLDATLNDGLKDL